MKQITELFNYGGIDRAVVYSLPENWDGKKAILDFHGNGEMAKYSDPLVNARQLSARSGLQYLIKNGFKIDYLVISPQSWGNNWDMNYAKAVFEDAKKKYGFQYAFGVGISMGGRIDQYAQTYPNDLIATVSIAGVRGRNGVDKRLHIPQWTIVGSTDSVVSPYKESLPFMKSIQDAGGKAQYTLFKGVGHGARLWNDVLDGSITVDQLDAQGFPGRKEYKKSHFPIGDWFESFIKEEPEPKPEPKPEPISMHLIPDKITGSHAHPDKMFLNAKLGERPLDHYEVPFSNPKWWVEARFEEPVQIESLHYYDAHGRSDFRVSFDSLNPITIKQDKYLVWRSISIGTNASVVRIEGDDPMVPIKVVLIGKRSGSEPVLYDLKITGATEEEKNEILKLAGDKAQII